MGVALSMGMKTLRTPTLALTALIAMLGGSRLAFADCPFDPDASSIATLTGDVDAAAAAIPEAAPCTATLGDVVAAASKSPEGKVYAAALLAKLGDVTGNPLSPAQIAGLLANPGAADALLAVSIPQVVAAAKAVNEAHPATEPKKPNYTLPASVDLANAASYFDAGRSSTKPVFGNVLTGDRPSDAAAVSDAQVKSNKAMAEILTRLSMNTGAARADRFTVTYRGHDYRTIDGFTRALADNGNVVTATVNQRIANFIDLSIANADGTTCDVKAAVSIKTGYHAPDGAEVVVPATHSGLRIDVHGPDLEASASYFQGIDGTGFFPEGTSTRQAWVGFKDVEGYAGRKALKAISAAGMWTSVVNDVAAKEHLAGGGYGRTGICDDSVALIQQILTGRTTVYPLSMDHDLMGAYLDGKIAEGGRFAGRYRTLRSAMNALPSDAGSDATQPGRILDSIPYGAGPTPFPGADLARAVLAPRS